MFPLHPIDALLLFRVLDVLLRQDSSVHEVCVLESLMIVAFVGGNARPFEPRHRCPTSVDYYDNIMCENWSWAWNASLPGRFRQ